MTITTCLCVPIVLSLICSQPLAKGGGFGRDEDRYTPSTSKAFRPRFATLTEKTFAHAGFFSA
jgi:hypothetical protein